MIPRRVVLENFLSFGAPAQAIDFTDDEPLWMLCGPNGVGKSAVFDAITYALFGCHRGGKGQGMDDLVRHGANGFRVEFEFGVGPREFRITRSRGKKSVERVFQKHGDDWKELDVGGGRDAVRAWAERELGLTFEQFTASVLLRQGEADRIILATGRERLAMLKKVIGVERYEALSARVGAAAKSADVAKARATDAVTATPPVAPNAFAAAITAEREAGAAAEAAREEETAAAARVGQAAEFARLSKQVADLTAQLDAAAARRATAEQIRAGHARLTELNAVLPTLAKLVPARDERAGCAPELERLTAAEVAESAQVATDTTARDAAREESAAHKLRADNATTALAACDAARAADTTALRVAEEVETIDAVLAEFPTDLDARVRAAAEAQAAARSAATAARDALVTARALFRQRETELADFGRVEVGATCSRCRQPVSAEHAEAERRDLADAVARLRSGTDAAGRTEADAAAVLKAADAAHRQHGDDVKRRDALVAGRLGLTRHAVAEPAAAVRARLAGHEAEAARLTAVTTNKRAKGKAADGRAKVAETARAEAERQLGATRNRLQKVRDTHMKADFTVAALRDNLTGDWAQTWQSLAVDVLTGFVAERDDLKASGVAADFRALGEDDALDADRARQRDAARIAIDAIPEAARIPEAAAKQAATDARASADRIAATRGDAERALAALHARREAHEKLVAAEKDAETGARVHAKLNRLLGADGLQRELVRAAERQIVRFADETVRHLSDGDLSVALDDAEDGPDKAFTLKVRRADSPVPTGVAYLSGSQKFRVAVAVALGIGRFATSGTQARPLESVIIDEGFGALDQDGLQRMADELHRLKEKSNLKRVLLVSHQEAFTARFPVGYELRPGDAGTVARPFRR